MNYKSIGIHKTKNNYILILVISFITLCIPTKYCHSIELNINKNTNFEFGGWIAAEYNYNIDDSPYDLGLNSNASRVFVSGEHSISDSLKLYGKVEYGISYIEKQHKDVDFIERLMYIGISSHFGSVEIGRVWSPFYDIAMYSDTNFSFKDTASGAFFSPVSHIAGFGRSNSSIKYKTSFKLDTSKLFFSALIGDQKGDNVNSRVSINTNYGASIRYKYKGYQVGLAHQIANTDGLSNYDDSINATIIGGMFNSDSFLIGGNYTIGKNNQYDMGLSGNLVNSKGIEGSIHFRFSKSYKVYTGYNKLTTKKDLYSTEFVNFGLLKNFNKKIAIYTEYRLDLGTTKTSLFFGDAVSVGLVYFISDYSHYF